LRREEEKLKHPKICLILLVFTKKLGKQCQNFIEFGNKIFFLEFLQKENFDIKFFLKKLS